MKNPEGLIGGIFTVSLLEITFLANHLWPMAFYACKDME